MANCALLVRVATCVAAVFALLAVSDAALRSSSRALGFPLGLPLHGKGLSAATAHRVAARKKDDYEYDYEEEEDDEDDYDYYGTKKKKPSSSSTGVQAASAAGETNVFNFFRIMILRLVWGFASMLGFEEPLSEAFNGAFVPPGVDDYGDDGLGLEGDY